jgi:hypothetical protein
MLKSSTGDVHILRLNDDGAMGTKVFDQKWPKGWTHAQFFTTGSQTYILAYQKSTGMVLISKMNADGTVGTAQYAYKWKTGWDTVRIAKAGRAYNHLFLMKSTTGDVHMHRMNFNGTIGKKLVDTKWKKGWTTARFFTTKSSISGSTKNYLFLLKKSTGAMAIFKMKKNTFAITTGLGSKVQSTKWSPEWTSATFIQHQNNTQLLLLKEGTGTMHWHEMNTNGTVGPMLKSAFWSPGWSNAEAYYAGGRAYLFLLKDD